MVSPGSRAPWGQVPPGVPERFGLEVQLERHLDNARPAKPRDLAERRTGVAGYGIAPIAVIHDVKEVGTEIETPPLLQVKSPAKGRVKLNAARAGKRVTSEISEGSRRLDGKCGRVEVLFNGPRCRIDR